MIQFWMAFGLYFPFAQAYAKPWTGVGSGSDPKLCSGTRADSVAASLEPSY